MSLESLCDPDFVQLLIESTPIPDGVLSLADKVLSNEAIEAATECPIAVPSKRKATDNSTQGVVKKQCFASPLSEKQLTAFCQPMLKDPLCHFTLELLQVAHSILFSTPHSITG